MPTILEIAGVDVPETTEGRSLLGLMRGEESAWRVCLHIEHAPVHHSLTDGKEKYIWFVPDGGEQFFDLVCDPAERHDLAGSPEHVERIAAWRQRLVELLQGRPEGFSDGGRLVPGRPYGPVIKRVE